MTRTFYRSIKVLFKQILPMLCVNIFLLFPVLSSSVDFIYLIVSINCLALVFFLSKIFRRRVLVFDVNNVQVIRVLKSTKLKLTEIEEKKIKSSGFSSLTLKGGRKILLPLFDLSESDLKEVKKQFESYSISSS